MSFQDMQQRARQIWHELEQSELSVISVGTATCGRAAGAGEVIAAIQEELARRGIHARVVEVGCIGLCYMEPIVTIAKPGSPAVCYGQITPDLVAELLEGHIVRGVPLVKYALGTMEEASSNGISPLFQTPVMAKQVRCVLHNCGVIDPTEIDHYIARGGYSGIVRALEMSPAQVIAELKKAGLRGRGGAGFPTWRKWQFCLEAPGSEKYVICNADEGDPGAFMNRSLLEGDPHSLLEGMLIAGRTLGAQKGYVYCRAEYPLALERIRLALSQMEQRGFLGDRILGSDFCFHIEVKEGAGAFVCGEETALIHSIEGKRGMPRPRPPFPATSGLWGNPTVINNVETLASVALILQNGADWFARYGTEKSKGTKTFALAGKVQRTGLIEVPLGTSLKEIIYEVGGGIRENKRFKAIQTGGPSGGCLPASLLDLPVDYEALAQAGSIMGSGGLIVMSEEDCVVDIARYFLDFTQKESCGKCVPCRMGTKQMLNVLERITRGQGRMEDLDLLLELAETVKATSLCGLGQTAPNPVLTTLRYFRDEYIAHIRDRRCPAGVCLPLVRARCTNACPAEVDVPAYVALVARGRYAEALEVHRRRNPFALVCGRVCPAFCETKCRRGELNEPLAIRQVKRFMADHELKRPWTPKREAPKPEKVAVIGAGPAGLTAALRLAEKGYPVTVLESLPVAGGMLAVGIPEYRLPRDILNAEIENIKRAGVEIQLNTALGREVTLDDLFRQGYRSVILAIGAHKSRRLGIPGEDLEGVYPGTQFLRDIALGKAPDLTGKKVVVVGGGDVAIDAVRSAWRLGASAVHLVYRRTRAEMPAYQDEVEAAEEEGVQFHFLTDPVRVLGEDRMTGVELQRQRLGAFDTSGRRRPEPVPGSEVVMEADLLIPAIGQVPDLSWLEEGLGLEVERNRLVVHDGYATGREGIFAAGDAVTGPATVVAAIAQGNRVADQVDHYLRTGQVAYVPLRPQYEVVDQPFEMEAYFKAGRPKPATIPVEERRGGFREVELCWDEHTVQEECKRCLRCDLEWMETVGLEVPATPKKVAEEQRV